MVILCAFGRLKARFGCLRRDMDISLDDLPYLVFAYFILLNFCEINKEQTYRQYVTDGLNYVQNFNHRHRAVIKQTTTREMGKVLEKRS